jgi:transposase
MVYVGVDLHRKRSHIVAVDPEGNPLLSRRIDNDPGEFLRIFGELGPEPLEVAFEATYGWGWFADLLADAGISTHMSHPLATKAISAARVKNDAVDARTLAHLLRTNLLPEAWIAPPEAREARRLVRMRTSLVRIRSQLKCQVHALVAEHAVQVPMWDLFGKAGRLLLADLQLPAVSQGRVQASLRMIDAISDEVAAADREIRDLFHLDPRVARLSAIPRVGPVTAAVVVAEVWDVSRFPSPDRLCSWAGLTPSERSSDVHTRRGHISKQGSRWLRWVMVEVAARPDVHPTFRTFHDRIARRRGRKIARVALARRVLTLCYYALRDEGGCRAFPLAG